MELRFTVDKENKVINILKNIHPKLLLGFSLALLACLVLELYPIYLAHSFQSFEVTVLGLAALIVLSTVLYSRANIKSLILDYSILFILIVSSFVILGILISIAACLIMYIIVGMSYAQEVLDIDLVVFLSLLIALFISVLVPKNKEHWPILGGSVLSCLLAVVWSLIKLHHSA